MKVFAYSQAHTKPMQLWTKCEALMCALSVGRALLLATFNLRGEGENTVFDARDCRNLLVLVFPDPRCIAIRLRKPLSHD